MHFNSYEVKTFIWRNKMKKLSPPVQVGLEPCLEMLKLSLACNSTTTPLNVNIVHYQWHLQMWVY